MSRTRTIRTRPRNGLAVRDALAAFLVAELIHPSRELWLVSGWVSDAVVIPDAARAYAAVTDDAGSGDLTLCDVLARLTHQGTILHVALRDDPHNDRVVSRLRRLCDPSLLHVHIGTDLHEKLLVGDSWLIRGSMNFTWYGLNIQEESVQFIADPGEAAQSRLELGVRWGGPGE